ncbi:MAG: M20 family metallopeptidase [Lacibacter sp.]
MLAQHYSEKAAAYKDSFIAIRRHLHAHPELSYEEVQTSAFIQKHLQQWGIPFRTMAQTGVVATIEARNPASRIIALRADMDALPIQEENEVPYKSQQAGVMHACGHDVHTTCLLGAARLLQETKDQWEGTVKLIFQPGEERNPGGASLMIAEGVLENPKPQAIVALHVHPGLATGKVSFRAGKVMASADELYITIKGKGGHAAAPHLTVDPIVVASHLILALQQLVSRYNNPHNPTVLSITSIHGGTTTNVIPNEVKLMGTFRAMDEEWRFQAHDLIRRMVHQLAESMGATADLHIDIGYPAVHNDPELHRAAVACAQQMLPATAIEETELRMGAEDFGYYTRHIPGCFFRLGVMNKEKGITSGVHTPTFDVDEDAIATGAALMAWMGAGLQTI